MLKRPALPGIVNLRAKHMVYRLQTWSLGVVLLAALSSPARAAWTLVSADSPITVVRTTNVFAHGTQSRVMLQADGHIVLLRGWMKIAYACNW
jgi:hypothetical protein